MRFGQIRFDNKITAALFEGEQARPVPGYSMVELIRKAEAESVPLTALAAQMASRHSEPCVPLIPINPAEVWACGCTYQESADFHGERDEGGVYAQVHTKARPVIFFKGTARVCVGPGQPVGIRFDSGFTAAEPGLAVVLGRKGKILGYTLGNDVSAWDIERENPLYLAQSKFYKGSCALGPVIVTPDELPELSGLEMSCTILRNGQRHFFDSVPLARLARTEATLVEYLLRANPVPAGSVLMTGTGVKITEEAALAPGDTVVVRIPEIGELSNPAAVVQ
jgi:2-dehydro-3-deoxy-D-arabinonate dehydratase